MHAHRPLGKHPVRHDPRTLRLGIYLQNTPPPPPETVHRAAKTNRVWPMYMNDQIGCCTCAGAAHMIETWTGTVAASTKTEKDHEVEISDAAVLAAYKVVGKYDPKDPATDNGANMLDVLNHWRKVGIGRHKIGAFVQVPSSSTLQIKTALYLFGGLYVGVDLPASAQDQKVWEVGHGKGSEKGSWGGHAIAIVDYDKDGLVCVTWGAELRMTWSFFARYCDEAYAAISQDYFTRSKKTPEGFDLKALEADLKIFSAA